MKLTDIDWERQQRCGFPEVVYGEGKQLDCIIDIVTQMNSRGINVLVTRLDTAKGEALINQFPEGIYNPIGRTFRISQQAENQQAAPYRGRIAILAAGTSDAPVAEEARETALWTGADVEMIYDVGVAGPQRLIAQLPKIVSADAVVVIAGMEGALPSIVGGYVAVPVIAVPTSVGYGANFGGLSALLSMLNSCASNVTVVNIDAGFKGAYIAGLIAKQVADARNNSNQESHR